MVLVQDDDDAEIKAAKRWCVLRAEAGQLLLFASEEQHALMNVEYSVSLRKCREEDRGRAIVQYRKSDPIFYLEIPRFEVLVDKEELQLFGNGSQRFICNAPSEKAAKNWVRELGAAGCEVRPQSSLGHFHSVCFSLASLVWLTSCGSLTVCNPRLTNAVNSNYCDALRCAHRTSESLLGFAALAHEGFWPMECFRLCQQ